MDRFPIELLKVIALKSAPGKLLTVNKKLSSIYDEDYYCQYLTITYPNKDLWKTTTYKNLFLKQTTPHKNISLYALDDDTDYHLILDFNGDLWWSHNKKLVDTHVTDIWRCRNKRGYTKTGYSKYVKNGSIEQDFVQKALYENVLVISNTDVEFSYSLSTIHFLYNIASYKISEYKDKNGYIRLTMTPVECFS
jgi:hypothetical protein